MEYVLYFFIGGMFCWFIAFLLTPYMQKDLAKIKNNVSLNEFHFSPLLSCFFIFAIILILLFLGFLLNLSAVLMLLIWLSTVMFNALPPEVIQYKDFLNIFVQIVSLFGTVSIAAAAYLFKKKS